MRRHSGSVLYDNTRHIRYYNFPCNAYCPLPFIHAPRFKRWFLCIQERLNFEVGWCEGFFGWGGLFFKVLLNFWSKNCQIFYIFLKISHIILHATLKRTISHFYDLIFICLIKSSSTPPQPQPIIQAKQLHFHSYMVTFITCNKSCNCKQ